MILALLMLAGAHAQESRTWLEYQLAQPSAVQPARAASPVGEAPAGFHCATLEVGVSPASTPDQSIGWAEVRIEVRRRQVRLVSVASASPGMEGFIPCIRRELALVEWGRRRADVDLRVAPGVAPSAASATSERDAEQ